MKKTSIRCQIIDVICSDGSRQGVLVVTPDLGDPPDLYCCAACGAVFAVDPEREHYVGIRFEDLRAGLHCPECGTSMAGTLPYPENFVCRSTGKLETYRRGTRDIPHDSDCVAVEVWDPLGRDEGQATGRSG